MSKDGCAKGAVKVLKRPRAGRYPARTKAIVSRGRRPEMQLTRHTDYAVRIMLHVGAQDDGTPSSISQIASVYGIPKNHARKLVQHLGQGGLLQTIHGRNGGLRSGRDAAAITIGQIVRHTEPGYDLVDCTSCLVAPACGLPRIPGQARRAFLAVPDRYTLEKGPDAKKSFLREQFGGATALAEVMSEI